VTTYIALLRAVNVGGTGKLPMADLRALCEKVGFTDVRTYIASGNVVFSSALSASKARVTLEAALAKRLDKPTQVLIRTADELEAVIEANPFPEAEPNRLIVVFLSREESATVLDGWTIPGRERLALVGRELFVHYPDGMGQSKLKVPFADQGTGRNMNSVRALLEMARSAP
jgi:uncharacterized protein (DUF1697 family)